MKHTNEYKIHPVIAAFFTILFIAFSVSADQNKINLPQSGITADTLENPVSALSEIEDVITAYDSLLASELKNAANVGAAAAIVYKNEIVYLRCFGVKKVGSKDTVDEHTIFRLASVSKTVSGVLAGKLFASGVLSPNQRIIEYLPELRFRNPDFASQLTLAQILSHSSGLPQHAFDNLVEQKLPLAQIIKKLPEAGHSSPPGEVYAYQNVVFSLFDTIVAVKTGKKYAEILNEEVFKPFGMEDASSCFTDFYGNYNKALPHTAGRNGFRLIPLNDRYYNTLAAAGINASISDMANFLKNVLNDSLSGMKQVKEIIFAPQIQTQLGSGYFSQWEQIDYKAYGMGWRIIDYKGHRIAYHGGFLKGYRAEIAVCDKEDVGIVFLSNSPNIATARSIPMFLNKFFLKKEFDKLAHQSKNH